ESRGDVAGRARPGGVAARAGRAPPADVLAVAVRLLSGWAGREGMPAAGRGELERAVAEVHGATGALVRWSVSGPVAGKDAAGIVERFARGPAAEAPDWRTV